MSGKKSNQKSHVSSAESHVSSKSRTALSENKFWIAYDVFDFNGDSSQLRTDTIHVTDY